MSIRSYRLEKKWSKTEPPTGFLKKKNNKKEKCTTLLHHFTKNTLRVKHCSFYVIQETSLNTFISRATERLKRC